MIIVSLYSYPVIVLFLYCCIVLLFVYIVIITLIVRLWSLILLILLYTYVYIIYVYISCELQFFCCIIYTSYTYLSPSAGTNSTDSILQLRHVIANGTHQGFPSICPPGGSYNHKQNQNLQPFLFDPFKMLSSFCGTCSADVPDQTLLNIAQRIDIKHPGCASCSAGCLASQPYTTFIYRILSRESEYRLTRQCPEAPPLGGSDGGPPTLLRCWVEKEKHGGGCFVHN